MSSSAPIWALVRRLASPDRRHSNTWIRAAAFQDGASEVASRARPGLRRYGAAVVLAAALLPLGACSAVPDALNPVEWARGVGDWTDDVWDSAFGSSDEAPAVVVDDGSGAAKTPAQAEAIEKMHRPGATDPSAPYPNVSSVPNPAVKPGSSSPKPAGSVGPGQGLVGDAPQNYADDTAAVAAQEQALIQNTPPPEPSPGAEVAGGYGASRKPASNGGTAGIPPSRGQTAPAGRAAGGYGMPSGAQNQAMGNAYIAQMPVRVPPPPLSGGDPLTVAFQQSLAMSMPSRTTLPPEAAAPGVSAPVPALSGSGAGAGGTSGGADLASFKPLRSERVGTIYFGQGSAVIASEDLGVIREAVKKQKSLGGVIRVVGHASSLTKEMDPMRHRLVNFDISVTRANAVARRLIRAGAKPSTVYVYARSDAEPVYYEVMPSGEAGNRRTEIYIDY